MGCWLLLLLAALSVLGRPVTVSFNADVQGLHRELTQISDPGHARYGQYLDNAALAALVGAAPRDLKAVQQLLARAGCFGIKATAHQDHVTAECPKQDNALLMMQLQRQLKAIPAVYAVHAAPGVRSRTVEVSHRRRRAVRKFMAENRAERQGYTGDPNSQRTAYGIPATQVGTNANNVQMVWGPGTYGYLSSDLSQFYSENNVNSTVSTITEVGFGGVPGGDNFGECTLDVSYSTGIGNQIPTQVSNTNTSMATEEGDGFGYAFMAFAINLTSSTSVPKVLSLSLGSLSAYACNALCKYAAGMGVSLSDCTNYMQNQRQVCMMDSVQQEQLISMEMAKLGLKGTTITAAAGDGGSHFSFEFFPNDQIGRVLNKISCQYNFDTFPASSPYVLAVGGTQWNGGSPTAPIAWHSGGSGFAWSFPQPEYQAQEVSAYLAANNGTSGFPKPGSFNVKGRAYPDVAALADNIPMVEQGQDQMEGGTSASAPEWAGVISLLNDARLNKGLPSLGFVNTRLYQAMRASKGALLFDVTSGNSRCALDSCCDDGFPATVGWDAMTGYGSPTWPGLMQYLASSP